MSSLFLATVLGFSVNVVPVGIRSMEVSPPSVSEAESVLYTITFRFSGRPSDDDVRMARELVAQMRRLGAPGTPEQGGILNGGSLILRERGEDTLVFDQQPGAKVLGSSGEISRLGGVQGLRSLSIGFDPKEVRVKLTFHDCNARYERHVSEVVQQYIENRFFNGQTLDLQSSSEMKESNVKIVELFEALR